MSSQRRIASSRANGAKSRGPVTPTGKQAASRNSLRHGFLAESIVLEEERGEAFYELLDSLIREHNAQTETQLNLIETMAVARWRIARLWAIEHDILQAETQKPENIDLDEAPRVARAFRALAENDGILGLLNRYESRLDRQYSRALNLLIKLADPNSPLTQFRQTNPVPQPDTAPTASGAAAGAAAGPDPAESAPHPPKHPPETLAETGNPPQKSPAEPVFPVSREPQSQKDVTSPQKPANRLLPTG